MSAAGRSADRLRLEQYGHAERSTVKRTVTSGSRLDPCAVVDTRQRPVDVSIEPRPTSSPSASAVNSSTGTTLDHPERKAHERLRPERRRAFWVSPFAPLGGPSAMKGGIAALRQRIK